MSESNPLFDAPSGQFLVNPTYLGNLSVISKEFEKYDDTEKRHFIVKKFDRGELRLSYLDTPTDREFMVIMFLLKGLYLKNIQDFGEMTDDIIETYSAASEIETTLSEIARGIGLVDKGNNLANIRKTLDNIYEMSILLTGTFLEEKYDSKKHRIITRITELENNTRKTLSVSFEKRFLLNNYSEFTKIFMNFHHLVMLPETPKMLYNILTYEFYNKKKFSIPSIELWKRMTLAASNLEIKQINYKIKNYLKEIVTKTPMLITLSIVNNVCHFLLEGVNKERNLLVIYQEFVNTAPELASNYLALKVFKECYEEKGPEHCITLQAKYLKGRETNRRKGMELESPLEYLKKIYYSDVFHIDKDYGEIYKALDTKEQERIRNIATARYMASMPELFRDDSLKETFLFLKITEVMKEEAAKAAKP